MARKPTPEDQLNKLTLEDEATTERTGVGGVNDEGIPDFSNVRLMEFLKQVLLN